jgi:membrane fusion protein, multidrug efflux system
MKAVHEPAREDRIMSEATPGPTVPARENGKRKRLLLVLAGVLVAGGVIYGAWWGLYARFHENTDDAYVAGNVIQVTPQVPGTVLAIHADDTDFVRAGAPLVELDKSDAKVALDQAEAQLAQTVREVRTLYTNSASLAATTALREADLAKAREDLARRRALTGTGAVSNEEVEHARTAVLGAEAAVAQAREQLASNQALIDHTTVESHPNVARAAARVEEAYLAYARAVLPAPVSGFVAKRSVQVGSRVAPGQPLMAVVPLDQVWVDANFKEVQLRNMRIGQPVKLTADVYGSHIEFHGRLAGLAPGTGSVFSLLPAQNATGNWIKVVQRVPVRVTFEPKELAEHPLLVGMSMQVDVDTRDQSGSRLASAPRRESFASTDVFGDQVANARSRVREIVAANLQGGAVTAPAHGRDNARRGQDMGRTVAVDPPAQALPAN